MLITVCVGGGVFSFRSWQVVYGTECNKATVWWKYSFCNTTVDRQVCALLMIEQYNCHFHIPLRHSQCIRLDVSLFHGTWAKPEEIFCRKLVVVVHRAIISIQYWGLLVWACAAKRRWWLGEEMRGVWSRSSKTKRKTKEDLERGCQRGLSSM